MCSVRLNCILILLFVTGCASQTRIDHVPINEGTPRNLVVFFDGTANDERSHTNVAKLHNLVTLQSRNDISATYLYGVGTRGKIIGAAMGWGIGYDVREAYLYLAENYNQETDQISIFGFSRGAYASRILAALIQVAGIPNVRNLNQKDRIKLVKDIYSAYKGQDAILSRRGAVAEVVAKRLGYQYLSLPIT